MPLMLSSDIGDEQTAAGEHDSCGGRIGMRGEDEHRALPGTDVDAADVGIGIEAIRPPSTAPVVSTYVSTWPGGDPGRR